MIFILGGDGFVGSAFVRACIESGLAFEKITRQNYEVFRREPCDVLINANGNSKKYLADRDAMAEFDASVRSVRASLIDFTYSRYIYLSSCDVYPDCSTPQNTDESTLIDVSRQSAYGFHKGLAELCVQHTADSWLIFRMGGFVGAGLKKNPIFDILDGGPLWLQPHSALQFMDVDTAARIVLHVMHVERGNQTFNLCGSGTIRLQEVIDRVGRKIHVQTGSPCVEYNVTIDKISAILSIPESRNTVLNYLSNELKRREESQ